MEDIKNIAYSNDDIYNKLKGDVKIIKYNDLQQYDNIDDAIGKTGNLVILYETKTNYGHWICIFKTINKNGKIMLSYFDPYGIPIDDQNDFTQKSLEKKPYLSKLIIKSPYNLIEYNEHQLQHFSKNISTCGPWCIARLKFKYLPLTRFYKLFKGNKHFTSDELVANYVMNYL